MNKRADGQVFWIIIVAALALLVLIVLSLGGGKAFAGLFGWIYKDCPKEGGLCKTTCGVTDTEITFSNCKDKKVCCKLMEGEGPPGGNEVLEPGKYLSLMNIGEGNAVIASGSTLMAIVGQQFNYNVKSSEKGKCVAYIWRVNEKKWLRIPGKEDVTDDTTGSASYITKNLFDCETTPQKLPLSYIPSQDNLNKYPTGLELRIILLKDCTKISCIGDPKNWKDFIKFPIEIYGDSIKPTAVIDDSGLKSYYTTWAEALGGIKLECRDEGQYASACKDERWWIIVSSSSCPVETDKYKNPQNYYYEGGVRIRNGYVAPTPEELYNTGGGYVPSEVHLCLYVEDKSGNSNTAISKAIKIGNKYIAVNCGQGTKYDVCGFSEKQNTILFRDQGTKFCCVNKNNQNSPPIIYDTLLECNSKCGY